MCRGEFNAAVAYLNGGKHGCPYGLFDTFRYSAYCFTPCFPFPHFPLSRIALHIENRLECFTARQKPSIGGKTQSQTNVY